MVCDDALLAETAKQAGNTHFRDKKYQHAIDSYTQSLEHQENAAVLCNRALCHSRLEEYGAFLVLLWQTQHGPWNLTPPSSKCVDPMKTNIRTRLCRSKKR
eukprot:scaffold13471_cov22-Tisochrysis_lutea.AAC.1